MEAHVLTRLDAIDIPNDTREVRVFGVVNNEISRLPHLLDYHRKLGVNRFFFVDNNSTDGTREFLLAQKDCHVFYTSNSYAEATYGIKWVKSLLDLYGENYWCLIIDADELFVYPHCEKADIHTLCNFMDTEGSDTIYTFMLDMYPKGSLAEAICTPDKSFLEITPYFDKDYWFVDRIHLKKKKPFPAQEVIGGPRTRCFYGNQGETSPAYRLFMHVVERGIVALRKFGIPFPYIRLKATPLFKVPLIKWKRGYAYTASTHQMNEVKLSSISGALLHFKFFSDFHARALHAVKSKEHAEGSIEYKRYLDRMDGVGNLMYEGSTQYTSSDDLVRTKLVKSSPAYEDFLRSKGLL